MRFRSRGRAREAGVRRREFHTPASTLSAQAQRSVGAGSPASARARTRRAMPLRAAHPRFACYPGGSNAGEVGATNKRTVAWGHGPLEWGCGVCSATARHLPSRPEGPCRLSAASRGSGAWEQDVDSLSLAGRATGLPTIQFACDRRPPPRPRRQFPLTVRTGLTYRLIGQSRSAGRPDPTRRAQHRVDSAGSP